MARRAEQHRVTAETDVRLAVDLDGGAVKLDVEHGFLAHLLDMIGRHGRMALEVRARGDVATVDVHHLAEDVGIVLGGAVGEALADRSGIERYGNAWVPMDETLAHVVLDVSGRPWCDFDPSGYEGDANGFNVHHLRELLRGFCNHAGVTMHVRVLAGVEAHHVAEAITKAFARALRDALTVTGSDVPSTKGVL